MRHYLALACCLLYLTSACGKQEQQAEQIANNCTASTDTDCSGSVVLARWERSTAVYEYLTFASNCSFVLERCGASGTIGKLTAASGSFCMNVTSTGTRDDCPTRGTHQCSYTLNTGVFPNILYYSCDGGATSTFSKM
jgi:hypothetical protein